MKYRNIRFLVFLVQSLTFSTGLKSDSIVAFAGGFGASSSKPSRTKKTKRGKGGLQDLTPITSSSSAEPPKEQQLDRFGLPVRTADNFFPPLPNDTIIIGADNRDQTTKNVVISCMKNHIQLNWDIFDENCVERKCDDSTRQPWKLTLLHNSPPVLEIENFMTSKECDQYIDLTKQGDETSVKVNSATFSSMSQSKRTSTTWFCYFAQVPTLLAKAKRLLNKLPIEQFEETQIVRYRTGEEFSWHYDEIPSSQKHNGGQRVATLLVYLNTIQKGGGTIFRDLKDANGNMLTMRPKKGSALLFFPALADGTPDDRTLHKGEVAVEEKMIAQIWVHERPYKPVIPHGNTHEAAKDAVHEKEIELEYF
jgi:prolyl 4-hydroxylase